MTTTKDYRQELPLEIDQNEKVTATAVFEEVPDSPEIDDQPILDIPKNITAKAENVCFDIMHTRMYYFKNDINKNIVCVKDPEHYPKYYPWYPMVSNGSFNVPFENGESNHYAVPEFDYQDFDKDPNIIKREEVMIQNKSKNHLFLPDKNILISDKYDTYHYRNNDYKIPTNLRLYDRNNNDIHAYNWNTKTGKIDVLENLNGKTIYADYEFRREDYLYKGYPVADDFIRINLNPNTGQKYTDPNPYSDSGFEEKFTRELDDKVIYFYIKPEYKTDSDNEIITGSRNPFTIFHTIGSEIKDGHVAIREDIKQGKYTINDLIMIGKAYVSIPKDIDNVRYVDTRTRGGGLEDE